MRIGKNKIVWTLLASCVLALAAMTSNAHATVTWKGTTSGTWSTGTNWVSGSAPSTGNWDNIQFDSNSTSNLSTTDDIGSNPGGLGFNSLTVTNPSGDVSINVTANYLTIGAGGINMSSATHNLTITGNPVVISMASGTNYQSWNVAAGRTLTITAKVVGGYITGLNYQEYLDINPTSGNTGTVVFGGTDDNSSLWVRVNNGELDLGKTSSSSVHAVGSITGIASGATVKLTGTGDYQVYSGLGGNYITTTGGTFDLNGNNLANYGGTATYTVTNASKLSNSASGTSSTFAYSTTLNAALEVNTVGNITMSGAISGTSHGITKTGAGTLTLSNTNNYTGATTISAGTLAVTGSLASGSAVTVASTTSSTLAGTGTVNGSVAVNSGGYVNPGAVGATGTLSTGAVTFNSGSTFTVDLAAPGTSHSSVGTSDRLAVTGALALGGTLTLNNTGSAGAGSYKIATQTSVNGSFSTINSLTNLHAKVDTGTSGSVFLDLYRLASANTISTPVSLGTIITGGTFTAQALSITNSAASDGYSEKLDASFGTLTGAASASGLISTLAAQSTDSASMTVNLTSTGLGAKSGAATVALSSDGSGTSGSGTTALTSQTVNVSGTILDHANASLDSGSNLTAQTIDFGNVLKGATVDSQSFTVYNRAVNTTAAYTANLKLSGFSASGDSQIGTNLAAFSGLAAGSGNSYNVTLNTGSYGGGLSKTISLDKTQLLDDSTASGAGQNNNGTVTVTVSGNVGETTAAGPTTYGTRLSAVVAASSGSYAGLASKVTNDLLTEATLGAGANGDTSAKTVSMEWRTRNAADLAQGVLSDVVNLTGMTISGESHKTAAFLLEMSSSSSDGYLATNVGTIDTPVWVNAVASNIGGTATEYSGTLANLLTLIATNGIDGYLGYWGADGATSTAWAVVNHNSEFAVIIPEPGTLALLAAGLVGLLAYAWRKQK